MTLSKQLNVNVIVANNNLHEGDEKLFFDEEDVMIVSPEMNMVNLLVKLDIFQSKGQAKKSGWKGKPIPDGFSEIKVGKLNHMITILNPSEPFEDDESSESMISVNFVQWSKNPWREDDPIQFSNDGVRDIVDQFVADNWNKSRK